MKILFKMFLALTLLTFVSGLIWTCYVQIEDAFDGKYYSSAEIDPFVTLAITFMTTITMTVITAIIGFFGGVKR
jgi:hypothetical protein